MVNKLVIVSRNEATKEIRTEHNSIISHVLERNSDIEGSFIEGV
jgi:hypothetical protein